MSKAEKRSGKGAAVFLILWILLAVAGGVDAVTLSANNLPDHHHMVGDDDASFVGQGGGAGAGAGISKGFMVETPTSRGTTFKTTQSLDCQGQSFSILPPYQAVYIWRRTA